MNSMIRVLPLALLLGGCQVIAMPPPGEFVKPLTNQRVRYVSQSEADRICGPRHPGNPTGITACAIPWAKPCQIILGPGHEAMAGLLEHELAHCPDKKGRYWIHPVRVR
jgi:hypothetical protein